MIFFSAEKRDERAAAERIYAACVAASRRPALYRDYGVPDTLQGRFEMLALHLFLVLNRLMHEPGDEPRLAQHVSECFVTDMDSAFREMGVGDVSVPKRMNTVYRSFAGRISAYRKALMEGDDALEAAVSRNVFPDGAADAFAAALARYLTEAVANVRSAALTELRAGKVPFPELAAKEAEEPRK